MFNRSIHTVKLLYLVLSISLVFVQSQILVHEYEHHHDEEHHCDFWLYSQLVEKQSYLGSCHIALTASAQLEWDLLTDFFIYFQTIRSSGARAPPIFIS